MKILGTIAFTCVLLGLAACGSGSSDTSGSSSDGTGGPSGGGSSPTESATRAPVAAEGTKIVEASSAEEAANAKLRKPDARFPSGPQPKEIVIKELRQGSGRPARKGDEMTIKFLALNEAGEERFSSWGKGEPTATFKLGAGQYFTGWDKGVAGMRKGSRREVFFPASTTDKFGALLYVIDLLGIE